MRTKKCRVCNIEKELSEFHKCIKQNATYLRSYCKECGKTQRRQWRGNKKDGLWYVYYLPEEHYVGITSLIEERIISSTFCFNNKVFTNKIRSVL